MDAERDLMQRVERLCGPLWDAISPLGHPTTSVPKSYAMAITATETGAWLIRNPIVPPRFEPVAYAHLSAVLRGKQSHYGAITQKHLAGLDSESLKVYATSHSLTQIMGYHVLRWNLGLDYVRNPVNHYWAFLKLTAENCHSYQLDPASDHLQLAEVWNSGKETGAPDYGARVIERMAVWEQLYVGK